MTKYNKKGEIKMLKMSFEELREMVAGLVDSLGKGICTTYFLLVKKIMEAHGYNRFTIDRADLIAPAILKNNEMFKNEQEHQMELLDVLKNNNPSDYAWLSEVYKVMTEEEFKIWFTIN